MPAIWPTGSTVLLRTLINDLDSPEKYTDSRLQQVLVVAGFQILRIATFSQSFTVDIVNITITPDPMDVAGQTSDDDFVNLMTLKAACIIDTGSAIKAANSAFSFKDWETSGDLKGVAQSTLALLEKGWCATYENILEEYLDGVGVVSTAVMSPFRTRARQFGFPTFINYLRGI